jgi:CHASE1-domain containing sensor protein
MEILSFAFGMLSMIAVGLIAVVVVGIVKVIKMQNQINNLDRITESGLDRMHTRVTNEYEYLSNIIESKCRELNSRIDELFSHVDSRIDKTENKIKNGNIVTKQTING